MDEKAIAIVRYYVSTHSSIRDFKVFTVWKCKTLQNWKYLISTDISDGMYYELTYNGDKHEWYLDAYRKMTNEVFPDNE